MFATLLCSCIVIVCTQCTHIFNLEKDFSKLTADKEVSKHVQEVLNRLKTFKVPMHPRIRLFYQLLKRGMSDYVRRTSDSLYNPSTYRLEVDNTS